MGDVLEQRLILFAYRLPIVAVHVGHIEEIAIAAPDFVEDLGPLFVRNAIHKEVGGGDGFLAGGAGGRGVHDREAGRVADQELGTITGQDEAGVIVQEGGFLAVLEGIDADGAFGFGLAAVVRTGTGAVDQVAALGQKVVVVIGFHGNAGRRRIGSRRNDRSALWRL